MNTEEILQALESMGSDQIKRIHLSHGAVEPLFGVKVGDMKTIVKKVKKNHALSLALYGSGNSDAMYLAGLIADEKKINKDELRGWARTATWQMVSEYTVPWVAAESPFGWELGLEWIKSEEEKIASSGWCTLAGCLALYPDEKIDGDEVFRLMELIAREIHTERNRVRYTMNGFLIAVGSYYLPLSEKALELAKQVGIVSVNLGGTACKVPVASDTINSMIQKGYAGKKRKTVRC
jgi:3-methyladenine DNA glycosylase AlkD